MPYADNKGTKIYYETYGDSYAETQNETRGQTPGQAHDPRPPLVLIHGNPADHWLWLYQIPVIAHKRKVIAVDLRAYGRSDKPTTSCTIADLSEDLLAVFHQEGLSEWVICGLSIGAFVAIDFTLQHPDKVSAAVLVGAGSSGAKVTPFMDRRIEGFKTKGIRGYLPEYFPELFSAPFLASETGQMLTARYLDNADEINVGSAARMYEAIKTYESDEKLAKIKVKTLIIAGEHDMAREMCTDIHHSIAGSEFHVIEGGSHCCCMDSPVAFNAVLLPFLDSFDS